MAKSSGYKNICRLDSSKSNSHGWYVRIRLKGECYAKFFSDESYDSPEEALLAAVEYRDLLQAELGLPHTERILPVLSRRNRSGTLGVQRVQRRHKGRVHWAYQVTWHPEPGKLARTAVSIDKYGEAEALKKACAIRRQKELEIYGAILSREPAGREA